MHENYKNYSLDKNKIKLKLNTQYVGKDFYFFTETTSTFDEAKKIIPSHGTVICATKQTNGRGRLGRAWQSDKGGIYFSLILMPEIKTENLHIITSLCAVAVQRAIAKYLPCMIKWPNDIISEDGKKLCGILTKIQHFNNEFVVNVGIGINANTEYFEKDLIYASSIRSLTGDFVDENELLCLCLKELEECTDLTKCDDIMNDYRKHSATLNKRIRLIYANDDRIETGLCTGIENDGSLNVKKDDGSVINVTSGEVSVRGIYGEQYA